MQTLLRLADEYGVTVVAAPLPEDLLGCFLPRERRIYLDIRLTPIERRSVLAHELGHVHLGHPRAEHPSAQDIEREERQADRFAAELLIDVAEYARLESISDDPEYLADELGVTPDLLEVYRTACLVRLDAGAVVVRPGRGEVAWRHRESSPI